MKILFIGYKNCSTSNKAEKYLKDHKLPYTFRDIKTQKPTKAELQLYYQKSDLPLNKLFNTSGKLYRELNLKDKIKEMSEEEILELLSSDGLLVKRPILVSENLVLFGFREEQYAKIKSGE